MCLIMIVSDNGRGGRKISKSYDSVSDSHGKKISRSCDSL